MKHIFKTYFTCFDFFFTFDKKQREKKLCTTPSNRNYLSLSMFMPFVFCYIRLLMKRPYLLVRQSYYKSSFILSDFCIGLPLISDNHKKSQLIVCLCLPYYINGVSKQLHIWKIKCENFHVYAILKLNKLTYSDSLSREY